MSVGNKLFSSVKYILTGEISEEVKLLLQHNGAEGFSYFSDYLTHCIVGDNPCDIDVRDAIEVYEIPAVTQEWVTYSHKCNQLLPTSAFKGGCNQLFTGVVASFSKLSQEDMKKLWAMLKYYGGTHSSVFKRTTTHLIVSKAEGCMYQQALKYPGKVHVVTPDWLVDSIRAGYLLDVDSYHPRLLLDKPPPNSESQCVQTTYPLIRPSEPNAELNCNKITSSKPLKEPEHGQPWEFDEKYNSIQKIFLNHLMSKRLQDPLKEQPLDSIVESNGIGISKSEKLHQANESKQEFQTYTTFLKSRLSALSDIGKQAMESSRGKLTFISPQSDTNSMNSQPVKIKESISPKTTKREILNRLDENQVLIEKQRTHHQMISCDGMLQPQVHSQQKFHIPDGPRKKSLRQDERSKRKSILETPQKKKLQPKGLLKKPPKLKAQSKKLLTSKISQQYLLQQKALQRILREAQEQTCTLSQFPQDKLLQAKIHKAKECPERTPDKTLTSQQRMVRPHSCCKRTYLRPDVAQNVVSPNVTSTSQPGPQPTQTATNYREDRGNPPSPSQSSGGSPWQGWDISQGSPCNGWDNSGGSPWNGWDNSGGSPWKGWDNSGGSPWNGWDVFDGCWIREETDTAFDHPVPHEQSQVTECSASVPPVKRQSLNQKEQRKITEMTKRRC